MVGDQRITKKQKVAEEEHKKVPVVKWANEQHQRMLEEESRMQATDSQSQKKVIQPV